MSWGLFVVPIGWMLECVFGVEQGILWSRKGSNAFTWNEHIVFGIKRGLLLAALFFSMYIPTLIDFMVIASSMLLAFPFFHNGSYYYTRLKIYEGRPHTGVGSGWFIYEKGFWSEPSSTSTAKINLSLTLRSFLFVLSLIILIISKVI